MESVLPIVLLVLGLILGAGGAWLLLRTRIEQARDQARTETEAERAALAERLQARQQTIDELSERRRQLDQRLQQAQDTETGLKGKVVQLATTLDQERKQTQEKLAVLEEAEQKLSDAFKALAADALRSSNQSFLELAKATLGTFQEAAKGDLEKRQQAIVELVKPVQQSLEKVDAKILDLEKARAGAYEGLREQVRSLVDTQKELRSETSNLVRALRRPQVRGRWGEIQLQRVVEMAGMLEHCDFFQQQSAEGEEGRLRPDLLVRLAGGKTVVVDAKAPLAAYLDAIEAPDEATRTEKLREHARQVRNHMAALGRKAYFAQFDPSPDLVVLFLPGEVFYSAALEADPELIEVGATERVILASPTTLIALLRVLALGWQEQRLAQSAEEIRDLGRELYKRLANLAEHWLKLGKSLHGAIEAYNNAVGSLETRVLVSARRFKDLGAAAAAEEIDVLPSVELTPRRLQAPEIAAGGEQTEEPA